MKHVLMIMSLMVTVAILGCNMTKESNEANVENVSIFPKGEIIKSNNFTGTVWVQMMGAKDSTLHAGFGNVTFEPWARTNWHSHPGGQLLFITEGKGYYQEKGQPARLLHKGDVVEIPRNVAHL
ncbi:cupin domain-containing protein [Mangrovibacterium sp.]|uniref:cupin domain-containing protein n=1 Tax=Mangrovibacterium sp. TaxID=1961364 RepID=UPI00356B5A08